MLAQSNYLIHGFVGTIWRSTNILRFCQSCGRSSLGSTLPSATLPVKSRYTFVAPTFHFNFPPELWPRLQALHGGSNKSCQEPSRKMICWVSTCGNNLTSSAPIARSCSMSSAEQWVLAKGSSRLVGTPVPVFQFYLTSSSRNQVTILLGGLEQPSVLWSQSPKSLPRFRR